MKRILIFTIAAIMLALAWTAAGWEKEAATARPLWEFFDNVDTGEITPEDIAAERYFIMVDEDGREITVTGRKIHVGDEYITQENRLYRVFKVEDRVAHARFIREVGAFYEEEPQGFFVMLRERFGFGAQPVQNNQEEDADEDPDDGEGLLEPEEEPQRLIGIYHTHNAESYVPTDGTDSIVGEGGIHNVGTSFAEALEAKGITVIHDETLHLPHDRGAYRRSRVTAERILAEGPDVLFDVHRDAAPMRVYAVEIEEDWVTQVQFVVGRQNANMQVIRQFALDLKNTADEIHPGLVKGIFMARGNYNQDMAPTNLLLEVGAHLNTREAAEDGITLFADVVSFHFYGDVDNIDDADGEQAAPAPGVPGGGPAPPPGAQTGPAAQEASRGILRLLGFTLFIIVGFLMLNAISLQDIRFRLAPYTEKLRIYNERVGHFLSPRLQRILPHTAKADRVLDSWQEKIRNTALAVVEKTRSWLASGDRVLAQWQVKIREVYMVFLKTADRALESGDGFAAPVQAKIHKGANHLGGRSRAILQAGDQTLAYWQEKIRDFALTVKEEAVRLYHRVNGRDKLR
jgi:stage II sporulation protein P